MAGYRYIVHVDMDAFFASVEQRDEPSYRGKPVIVGADPKEGKGRGVVSACSYEARRFGIHSAMPISNAYKKCPQGIFVRVDMEKYSGVSRLIFGIMEKFTPEVEPISIDEAFLDITGSYKLFGTPTETCLKIKSAIKNETGLTASLGMAPNKMTAKIASDIKKPDGFVVVTPDKLISFLHPLEVGKLWGIGERTRSVLESMDIHTIGDLAARDRDELEKLFGAGGRHIWELAHGIDTRKVETSGEALSVSNEYTFDTNTTDTSEIKDILMYLSEKVSQRLRRQNLKGKTLTLKIRFSDFTTYTRSSTLARPTNFADDIYSGVLSKMDTFSEIKKAVRLLGVKVSNLADAAWEDDLFDNSTTRLKKESLHKAIDRIINKFGEGSVGRRR